MAPDPCPDPDEPWERYASLRKRSEACAPLPSPPTRFSWAQLPDHGPGVELLGPVAGASVLELGCGTGENLVYLAANGARAIGVDRTPSQLARARARWSRLRLPLDLVASDAAHFLQHVAGQFDVCYSVFGALEFSDPQPLLPLIAGRLASTGRLVFSVRHHRWIGATAAANGPIPDALTTPDGTRLPVTRYEYDADGWQGLLSASGLRLASVVLVLARPPAPLRQADRSASPLPCCLIVSARPAAP